MFSLYDERTQLYQWDLNRKVIVSDTNICEVHFCNRTSDCSLVVEPYWIDDVFVADIPNILLQEARPIRAYAYCDDEYTLTEQQFTVKSRTKPSDYIYTETEVITVQTIEKRMDELEDSFNANINQTVSEYLDNNPVKVDLSDYYNKEETDNKITEVVNAIPEVDLTDYYTKQELDEALEEEFNLIGEELSNYCTTQEVNNAINGIDLVTSWDDLINKPFGKEPTSTITVDWNTFEPTVEAESLEAAGFIKVSDVIPTFDDLANGVTIVKYSDKEQVRLSYEQIENSFNEYNCFFCEYAAAVIPYDNFVLDIPGFTVFTFPEKGTYLQKDIVTSFKIKGYNGFETSTIKQIDEQFIPDTIARTTDVYTKAETDTAIYNSRDSYYLDFSNATATERLPATADMLEFITRYLDNKNVCAHIKLSKVGAWETADVRGTGASGIYFTTSAMNPAAINDNTETSYKSIVVEEVGGEWGYRIYQSYTFALTTKEYVDNAIANIDTPDSARSVYYLDFSSATEEWQDAPAEMGEFVTRAAANKDVFAYISEKGSTWHFAQIKGLSETNVILQIASLTPNRAVTRAETYYQYNITKNNDVWQYRIVTTYSYRFATTDYVDTAIANIDIPAPTGGGVKIIRIPSTSSGYTTELTAELWQYLNEYYNNRPDGSPTVPDNVVFYIQSLSMPSCWVTASTVSGSISQYGNYLMLSGFESKEEKYCHQYYIYFNSDGSFQRLQTTYSAAAPESSGSDWEQYFSTQVGGDIYSYTEIFICAYNNSTNKYLTSYVYFDSSLGNAQYTEYPFSGSENIIWYFDGWNISINDGSVELRYYAVKS